MTGILLTVLSLSTGVATAGEKSNFAEHAALTQLHRWFTYYENYNDPSIYEPQLEAQLETLTDDFVLIRGEAQIQGINNYRTLAQNTNRTWKNSHQVLKSSVTQLENGKLRLEADILYRNIGILPGGAVLSKNLHYSAVLSFMPGSLLPRFEEIKISDQGSANISVYEDVYHENRMRSLVHYWLATLEAPREVRSAHFAKELFATDFELQLGKQTLQTFEQFEQWFNNQAMSPLYSRHDIVSFTSSTVGNTSDIEMALNWRADINGKIATAHSRHHWIVKDQPALRFPKIQTLSAKFDPEKS